MGKATVEREKYSLKRRVHKEHKDKTEDEKHHREKQHRDDTNTKYNVSKSSRSFADDVKDVCEGDKLQRRHRHHHHRHHRRHHNNHTHSRHHHRHRERELHEADNGQQNNFTPPKSANTIIEIVDEDLEEVERKHVTQVNPALVRSDSPGMLSVSSSHSSLSTPHYSHSPAVIVDSETTHGHNSQHCSPDKNTISNSKRACISTPTTPKRYSGSNSVNFEADTDSDCKTVSSPNSSQRSKKSRSSGSSSSTSASVSGSASGSDSSSVSNSSRSPNARSPTAETTQLPDVETSKMEIDGQLINKENNETREITNGKEGVNFENLPDYYPGVSGCRSVEEFQCLNRIEEGTYGVVYRAKDKKTQELVALKRLKMEKETEGFPITSLREINTLLKGQHPNIVTVREIVVGSNMDQIFIVMDYVEHDMKSLMQTMRQRKQSFLPSEIKCLTQQLLRAVAHLHDNWILHRDLKTSNLLLSHKGVLKVADFGLAREYGSPLKKYTPVVVTLWYRAPELLLCSPEYSTPVDMWSVGCIFAEWLLMRPLFTGEKEMDQLNRIFKELGTPNEKIWKDYKNLPGVKNILSQNSQFTEYPISSLRKRFTNVTTDLGINLLQGLLTYDPEKRLTAERALHHEYFSELPLPIEPSMFPTWPAKSELGDRKKVASPKPPPGGIQFKKIAGQDIPLPTTGAGFQLKF